MEQRIKKVVIPGLLLMIVAIVAIVLGVFWNQHNGVVVDRPLTDLHKFSKAEMEERGHKQILYANKNQIAYLNNDGTKTIYLYSSNIFDEDDNPKSDLMREHNIRTDFTSKDDESVAVSVCLADKRIFSLFGLLHGRGEETEVENCYGETVTATMHGNGWVYQTQYGLNFESNITANEEKVYNYQMQIDSCYADVSCPEYILFRQKVTKSVVAIVYAPIIVTDSSELLIGTIKIKEQNEDTGEYIIESRICNENEYDSTVCQSYSVYVSKQPDSSVYSITPEVNRYLSQYIWMGGGEQKTETCIRFETLEELSEKGENIESAQYYIHTISGNARQLVIEPLVDDWCSFMVDWNSKPRSDSSISKKGKLLDNDDVVFDVTSIIREWLQRDPNSVYSIRKGVMLKNAGKNNNVLLASNDNGLYGTVLVLKVKE